MDNLSRFGTDAWFHDPLAHGLPAAVGNYVLLQLVGQGPSADIWTAREPHSGRNIAAKIYKPNPNAAALAVQLRDEQMSLFHIAQENVHRPYEIAHAGDRIYVISDYIE